MYIQFDSVYTKWYIRFMLNYEKPNAASESSSGDVSRDKERQPVQGNQGVGLGKVGIVRRTAECRSITLEGCGDHSGKDINNAMSLDDFYRRFVCAR